jgi:hypothetical protein
MLNCPGPVQQGCLALTCSLLCLDLFFFFSLFFLVLGMEPRASELYHWVISQPFLELKCPPQSKSSLLCYWEVADPSEEPNGRNSGQWGGPWWGYWDPAASSLFAFVSQPPWSGQFCSTMSSCHGVLPQRKVPNNGINQPYTEIWDKPPFQLVVSGILSQQ